MKIITDLEVAQMFAKTYTSKEKFVFTAPCGSGDWDGKNVRLKLNGNNIDPEAIKIAPHLAPVIKAPPPRTMPNIAEVIQDFNSTLTPLFEHLVVTTEEIFTSRLAACRSCEFWHESTATCSSPLGEKVNKLIWRHSEKCPETKWAN